jgi:hypothetical protein
VNVKEIGKFYQNKNNGIHWVLRKSNAKSMDIDMERICFLLLSMGKEFEKAVKKAMDMVDVFLRSLSFIIIPV